MAHVDRRQFIQSALAAGTALATGVNAGPLAAATPSKFTDDSKLNLAVIGSGGRGMQNLKGVASENIVTICDVDAKHRDHAATLFPDAKLIEDFREALDHPDLDGVVISTPDHMHAIPIVTALRKGLPVYCEKPLTHSIHEARIVSDLATQSAVPTQMGNQIHSGTNYRRVVEWVQSGVIGPVRRVHVWQAGGVTPGMRVTSSKVPEGINYDLWLGPAPWRPFHESHFHHVWRFWWDFGCGQLGDFVCHYMDLPYWALELDYPEKITAKGVKGHDGDNECPMKMQVDYQFAARDELPPVHITWYHGGWMPEGAEQYNKNSAVLFEGEDGRLLADYTTRKVFLSDEDKAKEVKPYIADSIGHHLEWIEAIKGRGKTNSPFEYGAKLTECGHLGNLSYRMGGREFEWDANGMRAVDCPEADELIRPAYREGWSL